MLRDKLALIEMLDNGHTTAKLNIPIQQIERSASYREYSMGFDFSHSSSYMTHTDTCAMFQFSKNQIFRVPSHYHRTNEKSIYKKKKKIADNRKHHNNQNARTEQI